MSRLRPVICGSAVLVLGVQQPIIRSLGPLEAEYPEALTTVSALRELSDGRVIVVDSRDQRIVAIDMNARSAANVGRRGPGPGEFKHAVNILALPADSSLVLDLGDLTDALLIGPQAKPVGTVRLASDVGARRFWTLRNATDAKGRIYSQVPVQALSGGTMAIADSAGIERFDPHTGRRDTVAYVGTHALSPVTKSDKGGGISPSAARPYAPPGGIPPFAARDQWAVSADGRVAIVEPFPYTITLIAADGERRRYHLPVREAIALTEAHKKLWREEKRKPTAILMFRSEGVTAEMRVLPYEEPQKWPRELPPFLDHAVWFGPDGALWVRRTTAAGDPSMYDVIDRHGQLGFRLRTSRDLRLVGFGRKSVYFVRIDDVDLEHLQRYQLPH